MLGGVLVLCCFALLGLEALLRGDARYARVGSGAARRRRALRSVAPPSPACCCWPATALLALGVPLASRSAALA